MLLELLRSIAQSHSDFGVFNYLTLRALLACLTAFAIGLALGPAMIARLKLMHFGQAVRTNGPKTHLVKDGTPTMGGALILFAITVSTLLWADLGNRFIWVVLFVMLGYGAIGWIDDYRKVVHHNPRGMSAREKFSWQSVIAVAAGFYLAVALSVKPGEGLGEALAAWYDARFPLDMSANLHLLIPCFKEIALPFGLLGFMIFTFVVVVGSSNAVNLTDGLDGLAILPTVLVGSALGIFCYAGGRPDFASYLFIPYIPGAGELVVFAGALAGAGLAFLWFNAHPAQVFMGDVGALALGGALGTMAVVARQELVLAVMGGVFVVETLSVMIQTVYFRLSHGKRVFLMAPIHHHFELKGWKETQVVTRFWIITFVLVLIGLSTLKIR